MARCKLSVTNLVVRCLSGSALLLGCVSTIFADMEKPFPIEAERFEELVVVDARVKSNGILTSHLSDKVKIIYVAIDEDPLSKLLDMEKTYADISALHIITHGGKGELVLGNAHFNDEYISRHEIKIAQIGKMFSPDGDILVYGCDVASGEKGEAFISRLAGLTGTDISASIDKTGTPGVGANWSLEYSVGVVENAGLWAGYSKPDYPYVLATSENFDAQPVAASGSTSAAYGSFTFTGNGGANVAIVNDGDLASGADHALRYDSAGSMTVSSVLFKTTDGSEFSLSSFAISSGVGSTRTVSLVGKKDGSQVYSTGTIDLSGTSGSSNGASYSGPGFYGTITFTGWSDLDELVINGTAADIDIDLDDIVVGAPITPNSPPTLGGTFTTAGVVNDNATTTPFSGVTVSDSDADNVSVAITYTGANGTLSGTGITGSAGSYTVTSAAPATATTNLQGVTFTPTNNQSSSPVVSTFTLTPNDGTIDGTANATTQITANPVVPTVSSVSVPSNTTYVAGQNLDFTVNTSEAVTVVTSGGTPTLALTIGASGKTASYISGSGTTALLFRYNVESGLSDTDGITLGGSISLNSGTMKDSGGSDLTTTLNSVGSLTSVLVDSVLPTISSVTIPDSPMKVGDVVPVSITAGEAGLSLTTGTVNGVAVAAFTDLGSGNYSASYTILDGGTDIAAGSPIPVNFVLADAAGNDSAAYTTAIIQGSDSIDANIPSPPGVPDMTDPSDTGVSSTDNLTNNTTPTFIGTGEANGTITLISSVDGTVGSSSINGLGNWSVTASTLTAGAANITATVTDAAGNTSTGSSALAINIDLTNPIVTDGNISISGATGSGGAYVVGDTITASWNNTAGGDNNNDINTVTVDFSQFGGGAAVSASNSSNTWTATFTLTEDGGGSIDATNRNVSVTATDNAANTTTTADTSNATVDNDSPVVTDANLSIGGATGSGGAYVVGDTITATWNNTAGGENNTDTINSVSVDFSAFGGGAAVAASNSSNTWTATYTIVSGSSDGTGLNISATATDDAGNATTAADTTGATLDNLVPTVTDGNISISGASGSGGAYKVGDTITATWNNSGSGDNNSDISSVTVDFSQFGGGAAVSATNSSDTWTATFTLSEDGGGSIDATNRNVSVTATDDATNATTTADTSNASVDNDSPVVSDGNISISGASGSAGAYITGDTVTASWNNTAGGDNNSDTISSVNVDFSAFGGASAVVATNSSNTWTASYTITAGVVDSTSLNVSVTATDNAGNTTTTADSSNATVDNQSPTVSDGNISISGATGTGGVYKVGDTVTATWNNSAGGDNNSDISSVTVNYSQLGGGAAVVASNSSDSWTATYTITEDGGGLIEASNLNVSVTATDNAGNATTTVDSSNASVDNNSPDITGVTVPNTAMKVGDAVVVSITAGEAGLSLSSGTVNGVSVTGFSDDGGGSYSATYTIINGGTDRAAGESIPVSFVLNDSAGNSSTAYTTAITQNSDSIDANNPGSASGTLSVDENSANGTGVGTVTATDASSYSLTDDAGGRFAIASVTGIVTVADGSLLNYEASSSHNITVRATDSAGNTTDTVLTVTVNNVNEAPVITNLDGDAVSFSIGGVATVLDDAADATLTDGDSADFNGGNITASVVANAQTGEDVLLVGTVGNIATSGSNVTHTDGFTIGTTTGGTGGTSLVITLNANATLARVQDLLSALQYTNTNASTTSTAAKTVRITANDGDGASAISASQDVTVSLVRAPIIDLDGDDSSGNTSGGYYGSFTEDGAAVAVADSDNTISDDGTFKSLTVTLSNRPDTTAESLASTLGTGSQTVNSEAVTIAAYDAGTGVLTITVDDGSASAATMQQVIASTRYNNASDVPDTTNRSVNFVAVDNADNTGVTSTATISIATTNDQPGFSGLDGTPAFIEDGAAVVLDSNVVVADAELDDADNYSGATLTLVRNGGASSYDQFSASGSLSALTEGSAFNLGGADIGTVTTNSAGTLLVTFNASATAANVDSVLQSIAYSNSNNSPASTAQIDWTFNDGNSGSQGSGGALTATGSTTVVITETNDSPTGAVTISGSALEYQTLTAVTTALADADGLGSFSYQWKSATSNVGSNTASYALTASDIGNTMTVIVSYTDGSGNAESVVSTASAIVVNTNDSPTGSVTISGTATEDQTLTASNTLADADGLGTITYQWQRAGTDITGATNNTYVLGDNDVGQTITVSASYIDGYGTAESLTSSATSAVVNVNDAPTGSVTISGIATEDQTLTAANTLVDADGLGTITYQWQRAGTDITGATNSNYVLGDNDVGQIITVTASYTDAHGTAESSTSSATSPVANVNDAPTGSVTISGTVTEDQTLTAVNTLADADGLGTMTYQWLRSGSAVSGATSSSYTLGDNDVGYNISVTASYTDSLGTAESVTSNATAAVANVNDPPTGSVNFTGTEIEGYTLTASNTLADIDGLGSVSYQWQRGASNISGATAGTYTLTASDVGSLISVVASYVDGQGFTESVSSSSSGVIDGDMDGDGTGDASDPDIDGDGMLNSYEDANGLDKLNASDRDTDLDGDGVSNYNESVANSNANADDQPPVVTAPGDVNVNATGLFTAVTIGLATAEDYKDGSLTPRVTQIVSNGGSAKTLTSNPTHFSPGVHVLTWTATDAASNSGSAIQTVNVTAMVEFSKSQIAREGDTVTFKVILNGPAVTYPVTVPYTVGGTAATDGSDHNLVNGSVDITTSNLKASVTVNLVDDGAGEGDETLLLSMGTPTNAIAGPVATHRIEIHEVNIAPLVSLTADQGSGNTRMIDQGDGNVTVTATVVDSTGDSHTYDWSATDNSLIDTDSVTSTFTFDPSGLTPGLYKMDVAVSDGTDTRRAKLWLNVIAAMPTLTATDTDGDGSNDDDEGAGDSDNDGIPDYLDHMGVARNVAQERSNEADQFLMETEPGLALSLGQVAFRANGAKTGVTEDEIEEHANNGMGAVPDENYSYSGGLFDFNVDELPVAGQQVHIVLAQFAAIPANAVYRKLMSTGWQDFVIDANNSVASAPGAEGYCPPPVDSSYTNGLTEGHWCVQLTIQDGGPNDADGEVNQAVDDPGGVAVMTATPVEITINGSGALSGAWLSLLALAFAYRYVGRSALLILLCLSGFVTSAQAESSLKPDYLGLALLNVKSDERSSDFQAEIDALSLSATVSQTDLSRKGWSPFIGYQLQEYLALEITYVDLGNVTTTISGVSSDVNTFVNALKSVYPVTASGWTIDLLLSKALNERLTGLLTLGAFMWEADYKLSGTNINKNFEDDGLNTHLGLALEYSPSAKAFMRFGWQSYRFSGVNVDAWLIGIGARF